MSADAGYDPPERLDAWLRTIAATELRALDVMLMLDLVRIEPDEARWRELTTPLVSLMEDLLLVGDFDAAAALIDAVLHEAGRPGTPERRQLALTAIDVLIAGSMMRHLTMHLATLDEARLVRVTAMSVSMGEVLVRPLTEALSIEERPRTRERLASILLAFGPLGRRAVERLTHAANPAVRRTATRLLQEFGASRPPGEHDA